MSYGTEYQQLKVYYAGYLVIYSELNSCKLQMWFLQTFSESYLIRYQGNTNMPPRSFNAIQ